MDHKNVTCHDDYDIDNEIGNELNDKIYVEPENEKW